jgi:probable HAF family extracellular repeat protein
MLKAFTQLCVLLSLIGIAGAQSLEQAPQTCSFQSVQIQKDYTSVYGINNNGAMVGTYTPASNPQEGFVLLNGTLTSIEWPGAAYTNGYGINDNGVVVGSYAKTLMSAEQAYAWSNGKFLGLQYPGALATYAYGINLHNQIVGSYQDAQGVFHGFSYSTRKYTSIDYPGAQSTIVSGINNDGDIVGAYTDSANVEHGFLDQNGSFTIIDYPGAGNTDPTAVNDRGVVAGTFYNTSYSTWDGFVWINGTFRKISDPSTPTQTAVGGINNAGVLVGNADYSGAGFEATGCVP